MFRLSIDWPKASTQRPPRRRGKHRSKRPADARREVRQLLVENLEDRRLMAFNVLGEYATGAAPLDLLLAAIDVGSQPDLVVASSGGVGVQIGNADGTFGVVQDSSTGPSPLAVAAGDFTGDDIADVVTANSSELSLLVGNGDGTFLPPQSISLPDQIPPGTTEPRHQRPISVATGDLNADGKLDLVVAADTYFTKQSCYTGYYGGEYCYDTNTYDGFANVLLGNGTGAFDAAQTRHLETNLAPNAIAVGDLDGDGNQDVIAANGTYLNVLLGDGTGAVGSPNHTGSGSSLRTIPLGDVDGDGKLDALTSNGYGMTVQKGDGLGGFGALPTLSSAGPANSAVMGDVNQDGKLDLVAAGSVNSYHCTSYGYYMCYSGYFTSSRQATVLLGNGAGGFALPLTSSLGSETGNGWLPDVAVRDLTGDGRPELVTIDYYANKAIVATNDGDWHPPPAITISDATITEGNSGTVQAEFTVTIVGDHEGSVSVDYLTGDDQAVAGTDYTSKAGTLVFGAGIFSQSISVLIQGDTLDEYDEQFYVILTTAVGGQITDDQGNGLILDDDAAPLVIINNVSKNEGDRNTTSLNFTTSLSSPSGKWVSVDFLTANGTATTTDGDYVQATGSAYFAPGSTTANITVWVRGDKKREANETFFVNLIGAVEGTIFDNQGQATIVNDDGGNSGNGGNGKPPKQLIRVGDASVVEGTGGSAVLLFTVSLLSPSDGTVSVDYATKNGRAKLADQDYLAAAGHLVFAEGEVTKTVAVTIIGDKKKERRQFLYLELSNASEALIADHLGVGRILNDDRR